MLMKTQAPSIYWHDYETWGLSPALDRPSQFAGIRTDLDFNHIGEPDMFYCRLANDYLPDPESVLITGISPRITQSEGVSELEFASLINTQFTQVNTCVVGYNNIRFDDEFSRNIFYRNFYDPYEYSWKNGNSRWDIIDLVRASYALRPDGINWPSNDQGVPSFRLELLTKANGISHEQAHDATSDVYATIAIAKLIKQKAPKLFDYYFALRNKHKVKALIDCRSMQPLVHVSGMFGSARGNVSLVAPLVWHPDNANVVIVVDLMQDISPLLELSADELASRLYTKTAQLNGRLPVPLKQVHINRCPFLAIEQALLPENAERLGIDKPLCYQNLEVLRHNPAVVDVIKQVFQQEKKFDCHGNVDAMLYDGFFSPQDKAVFDKIRKLSAAKLATAEFSVSDQRFTELFFRYRARNFPQSLSVAEQQQWESYRQVNFKEKWGDYFSVLAAYMEKYQSDKEKWQVLSELNEYALSMTTGL